MQASRWHLMLWLVLIIIKKNISMRSSIWSGNILFCFIYLITRTVYYCRTGNFHGQDIFADCRKFYFADMIFSRIGIYNLTIYYAFLVNKSLKSYSRAWYFRGFVKIRENIISAKNFCPTVPSSAYSSVAQ